MKKLFTLVTLALLFNTMLFAQNHSVNNLGTGPSVTAATNTAMGKVEVTSYNPATRQTTITFTSQGNGQVGLSPEPAGGTVPADNGGGWLYIVGSASDALGTGTLLASRWPTAGTQTYTFTATVGVTYRMEAFALHDNTNNVYDVSVDNYIHWNTTVGLGILQSMKKLTFSYTNTGTTTIYVGLARVGNLGQVFQGVYLDPGATKTWELIIPDTDSSSYTVVKVNIDGAFAAGGGSIGYWENPDGTKTYDFTGYTTSTGATQNQSNGVATSYTPPGTLAPTPSGVATGGTAGPSGTNPNALPTTGGTSGSAPTQGTAAANTNAITAAINSLKGSIGGGGATDMTGVHSRLDTANTHLEKLSKMADGTHPSQTSFNNDTQLSDANAKAGAVTAYAGKKPTVSNALSVSMPGSATAKWGNWNKSVGNFTPSFSVASVDPEMDSLMQAGRALLLVACCIGFCKLASYYVTKYTVAMPQVLAQDTGFGPENIGPGVSQAKTYATAAAAVSIIFIGMAAIVALVDTYVAYYGGGITSIFAAINFPAASVAGMLDRYVPLSAMLGLTVLGAALPYVVAPMFLATAGVLRFIKT